MNIEKYNKEFIHLWENSSTQFPVYNNISISEKKKREEELIRFSKGLKNDIDFKKLNNSARQKFIQQFQSGFNSFFKNSFDFTPKESALVTESGLMGITKEFMNMARRFDPDVPINDIFQASRNLWIINSLQIMMGAQTTLTPSFFAYSMLYPYSDNYLDDARVETYEKVEFSKRFRQRLEGQTVIPANSREKCIFDLVTIIEEEWDRSKFSGVFDSLLAIHDAQTRSIRLLNKSNSLCNDDLLKICIEKGGTSVLADGYLLVGELTQEQERFCFGFGAFLQLVDDIQDIDEDKSEGLETIFTAQIQEGYLDEIVNRAIAFGNIVMNDLSCFESANLEQMSGLMIKSNAFLLTEAIGLHAQYYSTKYVTLFEKYSPFRYDFVRKRRSNMESNRISFMNKIDSFIFDEREVNAMQA
ncbi:MAG: class 1 isoprenoid biosynthesis enzyme [Prolixibacteraceae bacterium]|jgi:hypothetical protein|nr:class 1 isoprenoid biosynthesis enzyme [Prolixibacteraceae bacterium]